WSSDVCSSDLVEYAAAEHTYRLPREHASALTGSSTRNLTSMGEMFPLLHRVLPRGGPAVCTGPGSVYTALHPDSTGLMDRRSRPRYDELLFSAYLGKPEGLVARLEAGIRVADVG